jgi:hypothetical protein
MRVRISFKGKSNRWEHLHLVGRDMAIERSTRGTYPWLFFVDGLPFEINLEHVTSITIFYSNDDNEDVGE